MKRGWVYPLFNFLLFLALPFVGVVVLLRWHHRIKGNDRWAERLGRLSPEALAGFSGGKDWWWVHAVSVGEVKAIETFLKKIPPAAGVRVLLSVVTPEALNWAAGRGVADRVIAAPLDLPWIVRRVFRAAKPKVFISVESEFWPNLLREAKRSGAHVALINGRISARSFQSYQRVKGILGVLWEMIDLYAVRQQEDADRFAALGVAPDRIKITGNLKYDQIAVAGGERVTNSSGPVVVMGSTREGEESQLLPAMERIRSALPAVRFIWAPRHIERVPELEVLFHAHDLRYQRISQLRAAPLDPAPRPPHILWDSMGDLLEAYRQAEVAVIGGSFVPKGGQNPIEPAAMGVPVLFGPSMDNFQGVAERLVQAGGAQRVSLEQLEGRLTSLLKDPAARQKMGERARQDVLAQQGASERTLQLILKR